MRSFLKTLGYIILLAMVPVAVLGWMATPNEYLAMGVDAVDCDGPISVMIFAVPALAVYAIAAFVFLYQSRLLRSLIAAALCGLICTGLIWNIANGVGE